VQTSFTTSLRNLRQTIRQRSDRSPQTTTQNTLTDTWRYEGRTIRYSNSASRWYKEATRDGQRATYLNDDDFTDRDRPSGSRPPPRNSPTDSRFIIDPWETRSYYKEQSSEQENDDKTAPATPHSEQPDYDSFNSFTDEEDDMAVAPREIKLCSPTPFSGDPDKTSKFLQELELYVTMNQSIYDTDAKKVIFALSFMKGGTASGWSESFVNTAMTSTPANYGTWDTFKDLIKKAFSPVDAEGKARTDIKHLKQGSGPVDDYIAQFRILASRCGISNDKSLPHRVFHGRT
jgi:Retrotransposon gag protein